jgi:hypothetical protein
MSENGECLIDRFTEVDESFVFDNKKYNRVDKNEQNVDN